MKVLLYYLLDKGATLLLFIVYMIARVIKTPLWWTERKKYKDWAYAPDLDLDVDEQVQEELELMSNELNLIRAKDMLLAILTLVLTSTILFLPTTYAIITISTILLTTIALSIYIAYKHRGKTTVQHGAKSFIKSGHTGNEESKKETEQ